MENFSKYKEILGGFLSDRSEQIRGVAIRLFFNIFISYLLASTLAAVSIGILGGDAVKGTGSRPRASDTVKGIKKSFNYRTLRKKVAGRNIFNSDGEFPDEKSQAEVDPELEADFNPNAPCTKSSLNLELIGTIYMGRTSTGSLATIKEKGYNIADIYRVGEKIIGNPQAAIFAIKPRVVEVNHNGIKECLELKDSKKIQQLSKTTPKKSQPQDQGDEGDSSRIVLDNAYVTEALGMGYSRILKEGRLVPHSRENRLVGYKLIGVKSGSLYTKIGLKNGDVITGVNGISMSQAEQGFALYNALSEEKEIRLEYLSRGKEPTTITVEIR
jgi:type II secretion system protein C